MDVGRINKIKVILAFIFLLVCLSTDVCAGDLLNMPSMDVNDYKSVIIHHDKGGTTIGNYDQKSGNFQLSGPKNEITTGTFDGWGNLTVMEYGGEEDD
ncbi:MAG: hypothetical protein D4R73_09435 [Deltaproteobacteria bacterium]|nr:MAG: hypothetical protein D4R73_09435 [Deltaproteobacteria bacterium]